MGVDVVRLVLRMSRTVEVLLVTAIALSFSQYSDDSCNWILWEPPQDSSGNHGVRTVTTSCSEGSVKWRQPYGAIRIAFSPTLQQMQQSDVRVCFIVKSMKSTVKISEEDGSKGLKHLLLVSGSEDWSSNTYNQNFETDSDRVDGNSAIYIGQTDDDFQKHSISKQQDGGVGHFENLHNTVHSKQQALDKGSKTAPWSFSKEICLNSAVKSDVVIFLEAILGHSSSLGELELVYDVTSGDAGNERLAMQDCRPCTDVEIVEAACRSDFVVRGTIDHVTHDPKEEESRVHVSLDKLYRQTHQVFKSRQMDGSNQPPFSSINMQTDKGDFASRLNVKERINTVANVNNIEKNSDSIEEHSDTNSDLYQKIYVDNSYNSREKNGDRNSNKSSIDNIENYSNSNIDNSNKNNIKTNININSIDNEPLSNSNSENSMQTYPYYGHIVVPHKCRTAKGTGDFVFMGRVRLKRAHLHCAPRRKDFERLWTEAMRTGASMCVLG